MAIRAPFNFVPVSDKVFFPDWANQIQHDIPFSDGVSGIIKLKITAESPIFVRNGHTNADQKANNEFYNSFSNINDQYFIPGTSLKGTIRNVLEIMCFSKLSLNEKAKFAQREWNNTKLYTLKSKQQEFRCGWLKRKGYNYVIEDCGKPYRIGHSRIDEWLGKDTFREHFSRQNPQFNLNEERRIGNQIFDPKSASFKYHLMGDKKLSNLYFDYDNELGNEQNKNRLRVISGNTGYLRGTIVLTGQPDQWHDRPLHPRNRRNAGKFYEFVFEDKILKTYNISQTEFDHFKFIYTDSSEWKRINETLDSSQGAPVFFRVQNNKIKDFGLAYLYKLPYDKSPYDTLSVEHKQKSRLDLAECIFGTANKEVSLKGRVNFGHAFCTQAIEHKELIFTMGSPKASYYPIYIEQRHGTRGKADSYSTYNDSKIRGWKRYQIRESVHGYKNKTEYNETLDTKLIPLDKGSTFESTVRFHNLRPAELGALYSALTFHQTKECNHQIGHGKAFGLGALKIDVSVINTQNEIKTDEILADFEGVMTQMLEENWHTSKQIKHLFTIASIPVLASENHNYNYMKMSVEKNEVNEFEDAKEEMEHLMSYPELRGKSITPESYYQRIHQERLERKQREEKERRQHEIQQREKAERAAQEKKAQEEIKRREAQIEAGLTILEEKYDDGRYKVTDFKGAKNRIGQWLKKANHETLPEDEHELLINFLNRIYVDINKRERKQWEDFEKGVWSDIIKWIGKENAKAIFDKLIQS